MYLAGNARMGIPPKHGLIANLLLVAGCLLEILFYSSGFVSAVL